MQINHLFYIVCTVSLYHLACKNSQSLPISCFTSSSLPPHFFFTSPSLPSHFSLTSVLFFTASASGLNCIPLLSGLNCIYSLQSLLLPFHFLLTFSPLLHILFTSFSLPPHFLLAFLSLPPHFLFISFSLPPHSFFTSLSLLYYSLPPGHNCWQPVQCIPATYTFTFHRHLDKQLLPQDFQSSLACSYASPCAFRWL